MKLGLTLDKARYAVGERIVGELRLENDEGHPVEIPDPFDADSWQPRYTLVGPAHPAGFPFSFRSAARQDPRDNPGVTPALVTLAPGAAIAGEIPVDAWAPVATPGDYDLTARLEWGGVAAASPTARFSVEALGIAWASAGVDGGVGGTRDAWVTWIRRGARGAELGDAIFLEVRPDLGETKRLSMSAVLPVAATARDALCPTTNYDRKEELAFWRLWREGSELLALLAGEGQPRRLEVGPTFFALRPALMTADGALDVFAFENGSQCPLLARFLPGAPPSLLRGDPVAGRVVGGGAALGARDAGSARHAVLVSLEEGRLSLHHAAPTDAGRVRVDARATAAGLNVIPASIPAVRVEGPDVVTAVLLARDAREPEWIVRVDVRFAPDRAAVVETSRVGRLPREPRSARVVHCGGADGTRVDWAVLLEDGSLVSSFTAEARAPGVPPVVPLELVAPSQTTYLLAANDLAGPVLVPLQAIR